MAARGATFTYEAWLRQNCAEITNRQANRQANRQRPITKGGGKPRDGCPACCWGIERLAPGGRGRSGVLLAIQPGGDYSQYHVVSFG